MEMDTYWADFLAQHPALDPSLQERIHHFRYQYLMKVSNVCSQEAALFQQNISPWSSRYRGDYHRLYHLNSLLEALEECLGKRVSFSKEERLFVIKSRLLFEKQLEQIRNTSCLWQKTFAEMGFKEKWIEEEGVDLLIVPLSQQEALEAWIAERGLAPSLQEACLLAARFQLWQPNSTYLIPKQLPAPTTFKEFFAHPIFQEWQNKQGKLVQVQACLALLKGCAHLTLDERFQEKDLTGLFQDSLGRVLYLLTQMQTLDVSQYLSLSLWEKEMEGVYEEMILWLLLLEPYPKGALEEALIACIPPPSYLRVCASGMGAFAAILQKAVSPEHTLLIYEGCYYENRAVLLKSFSEANIYLVRAPDYATSLEKNLEALKKQGRKVDVVFLNLHENMLKGRLFLEENPVFSILERLLQTDSVSSSFQVVIDTTIGYLNDPKIRHLLSHFIEKGVQFWLFWSHQKFDLLGLDKGSGGTYCLYSRKDREFPNDGKEEEIDGASRQILTHFFRFGASFLEERRRRIFAHAAFLKEKIDPSLQFDPKQEKAICVVDKRDPENFSIDVQCDRDREEEICKAFQERGIPLLTRSGFGFNLTSVAFTRFHMARFSIGLEEAALLLQWVKAFNEIFQSFC